MRDHRAAGDDSRKEGAEFRAFDGQLSGMILAVAQPSLIVQSWRSFKFHDDDADSILILSFTPAGQGTNAGRIDLVHLDVPEHDYEDVTKGWQEYYWSPWRTYLQAAVVSITLRRRECKRNTNYY